MAALDPTLRMLLARRAARVATFLGALLACATPAVAQADLGELALGWTHGDFRSPIICDVEGKSGRVLRRVEVGVDRRITYRPTNSMIFHDLEAPGETHCYRDDGHEEPNVIGSLRFIFEGRRGRSDTAARDFQDTLRREGGFDFVVARGRLRVGKPGAEEMRTVDFSGATARFEPVRRGSHAYNRLAEFGPRHKLSLTVTAKDGTELQFDLVAVGEQ